jgi:hypothetical protein
VTDTYFYPAMGVLALGVLWLNTLLIAAAALTQRRALTALVQSLARASRDGSLMHAKVTEGAGFDGAIVTRTLQQVGRAITLAGPDRILFTEADTDYEVHGGAIGSERLGEGEVVEHLWLHHAAPLTRTLSDFDDAFRRASTTRGLTTSASTAVRVGEMVWFQRGQILASIDPLQTVRTKRLGLLLFASGAVVIGAGLTTAILWPPIFGTISTAGGAGALLFFLLVQPAGVKVRDWARLPDEQPRSDVWQR